MKVPTHILKCVKSTCLDYDGRLVRCEIACSCKNYIFELLYPGETHLYQGEKIPCTLQLDDKFFFLIKARCAKCGCEYLLFDKDFHGWDGFVCHNDKEASHPRPPLVSWECLKCGESKHTVQVEFCYGDEDEMIEDLAGFPIDNLADAFEWIYINIKCVHCDLLTEKWVDYETA